jgi:hypothetical protein
VKIDNPKTKASRKLDERKISLVNMRFSFKCYVTDGVCIISILLTDNMVSDALFRSLPNMRSTFYSQQFQNTFHRIWLSIAKQRQERLPAGSASKVPRLYYLDKAKDDNNKNDTVSES